jgi:hypothetical protein
VKARAILAGWATDWAGTLLFIAVLTAIVAGDGASPEQVAERMTSSTELLLATFAVGLAFTGVGGYVAAAVAGERHLEHAAAAGTLSLGLGLVLMLAAGGDGGPAWLRVAGYLLTIPIAVFGGYYRMATERVAT